MAMNVGSGRRLERSGSDDGHQHHAADRRDAGARWSCSSSRFRSSCTRSTSTCRPAIRRRRWCCPKSSRSISTDVGAVYWNGEVVPDRATLEEKLKAASAQAVQPELHLRPDKSAKYAVVAAVMASAQRLGLTKIGIVGSEQFIESSRRRNAGGRLESKRNGFRTAAERPDPACDRDRVRRSDPRDRHLCAGDGTRAQGRRGDQEAAHARRSSKRSSSPPPPPPPPPKKIVEPPKAQHDLRSAARRAGPDDDYGAGHHVGRLRPRRQNRS